MNTLLFWLLQNAIVVTCFTPLVWLACRCLRSRPAEQHLLWTLLLAKLMLPPQLTGALPLERLAAWWPDPPTNERSGSIEQVPVATLEVAELVGMSPADSGQELLLMPLPVEYAHT
jgi:hypothetical protein